MKLTGLSPNTLLLGLNYFQLILGPICTYVIE